MNKVSFDIFIKMLGELNEFIAKDFDPEYILEVRAIGGFSMIIHKRLGEISGPREESRDIDSLTKAYPDEIIDKITGKEKVFENKQNKNVGLWRSL